MSSRGKIKHERKPQPQQKKKYKWECEFKGEGNCRTLGAAMAYIENYNGMSLVFVAGIIFYAITLEIRRREI